MAVAFAPTETTFNPTTQLTNQAGTVTVTSRDTNPQDAEGTSNTQTTKDGSEDYTISTQTVTLGKAFSVDTLDDYMSDNGEKFEVAINTASYTAPTSGDVYENVSIDTNAVTTTITDNSYNKQIEADEEIVYVKISQNDVAAEGDELTHKVELYRVIDNGDGTTSEIPVEVPVGETVTINLNYDHHNSEKSQNYDNKTDRGDFDTLNQSVVISGGNSSVTFENDTAYNSNSERDEWYDVSIDSVDQTSFESIQTEGSARGTIIDYDITKYEDNRNTQEDGSFNIALFDNKGSHKDAIFIDDENNGSTYDSITISGIPTDAVLKDGAANPISGLVDSDNDGFFDPITLTNSLDEIRALTITPATDSSTDIHLSYEIASSNTNGDTFSDKFAQRVEIRPDADEPYTLTTLGYDEKTYDALEDEGFIILDGLTANIGETTTSQIHDNEIINKVRFSSDSDNGYNIPNGSTIQYDYTKSNGTTVTKTYTFDDTHTRIDIQADKLDTIKFKSPDDFNGEIHIKMQTQAKDIDEDSYSTRASYEWGTADKLIIKVSGSADAPIISIVGGSGLEDAGRDADTGAITANGIGGIPIELGAYTKGETETIEFIISDIPDDAFIFDKNGNLLNPQNGDGSYVGTITIPLADTAGLTIVPPHDSNVDFDLTVVGKSTESNYDASNGGVETNLSQPQILTVGLTGVIDAPVVETNTVGGLEDNWISFGLNIASGEDQNYSETLYATLEGIPKDSEIRIIDTQTGDVLDISDLLTLAAVHSKTTDWRIDNDLLADLNAGTKDFQILPEKDFSGELKLGLEVTAIEDDGDRTSVREEFILNINPVIDTVAIDNTQEVKEDTWTALDLPMDTKDSNSESIVDGSIKIVIPNHIEVRVNGVDIVNDGSEISLNLNDAVEILAPLHSNIDFDGIVFTKDVIDESKKDSQLDGDEEIATTTLTTNIAIDMIGVADGWDADLDNNGTISDTEDGFKVQNIDLESTTTIKTLYTAVAYEGDGYESFENAGNVTAANAAVSYVEGQGLGVQNQNLKDVGQQTKAIENNESLLLDFGKEISDFQFTINQVGTTLNGQYIVYGNDIDTDTNKIEILGTYDINTPFPTDLENFRYVAFDAFDNSGGAAGWDNNFYINITRVDGVDVPVASMQSGTVTTTTVVDTNETTLISDIITKNITIEDAHDITDNSETEYYIIQNGTNLDNPNTLWSIDGAINAGNGTWLVTEETLTNAEITINNMYGGDGTLDLQIIPATRENDGDVKFDDPHPFTIAYTILSGTDGSTSDIPVIIADSTMANGVEDEALSDTDFSASATTNSGTPTISYIVNGVTNGNLNSEDPMFNELYQLPNGSMVTANIETVDNIMPSADFNGELNIDVTIVATNTSTGEENTLAHTITADISPVLDTPTVNANGGSETDIGETINLNLSISSKDNDGSENLSGDITITAKDGGTFSNGTDTITVSPAELSSVVYTPPAYKHGTFEFDISYDWKDTDQFNTDDTVSDSISQSFSINLASHVDDVSVVINPANATVLEGNDIPLGIYINQDDNDGSEIASMIITGLPDGVVLNVGTMRTIDDGNGQNHVEFVLKASEVPFAKIVPDEHYSGDFTVSAKVLNYDIKSGEISESSVETKDFSITPVASNLTVDADGFGGDEGSIISVNLDIVLEDTDLYSDAETLNVTFNNVEVGSKFTIDNGTTTFEVGNSGTIEILGLTQAQAENLSIIPPLYYDGTMNLEVSVKTVDGTDILANGVTDTFSIVVEPVTNEATLTINETVSNRIEGTNSFALNISASVEDSDQTLDIILNGVQGTLNNGIDNGNGQWTLTKDDLTNLEITPASDISDDFDISVKATTKDGSDDAETTSTQTISINAKEDEIFDLSNNNIDGLAGSDTLTIDNNDTIDFSNLGGVVKNIENIDLTNNGIQDISISLDDVLEMTSKDDNNINLLEITGDTTDEVKLDTTGWSETDNTDTDFSDGKDYYNDAGDSITLTVDTQIIVEN